MADGDSHQQHQRQVQALAGKKLGPLDPIIVINGNKWGKVKQEDLVLVSFADLRRAHLENGQYPALPM